MEMHKLYIDPGGSTGWATITVDYNLSGKTWGEPLLRRGELTSLDHHSTLWKLLCTESMNQNRSGPRNDFTIVYEGFDNRANPAAVLISLQYIGIIRLFAMQTNTSCMEVSPPQKEWATNRKLQACGLYHSTKGGHQNDASRYLLKDMCYNFQMPYFLDKLKASMP